MSSQTAAAVSLQAAPGLNHTCPNCGHAQVQPFYSVSGVPVHSVLLMKTREIATNFPKGNIDLALCSHCGFITNAGFDASVHCYSGEYEETQGYSETFRAFHRDLALSLIEQHGLRGKHIIEIGCGKGEFLALLCQLGGNTGVGFDPAFVAERNPVKDVGDVQFVADFYSEKYAEYKADFICCKMTLEHIPDTLEFLSTVRRSIGEQLSCTVFFMIPNMTRVLEELAFWDVYYEHCSYFTRGSLTYLFEKCGFSVLGTSTEYAEQYLTITACPTAQGAVTALINRDAIAETKALAERFREQCTNLISRWRLTIADLKGTHKIVVWGSGSKGVAFLSAVQQNEAIQYVVDINPHRQGKFMAGTGQEIVAPEFLASYRPDVVIVMNSIYRSEIQAVIDSLQLDSLLLTL